MIQPITWERSDAPFDAYDSRAGVRVLQIHYTADDDKRGNWGEETRIKLGIPKDQWEREMELACNVHDGLAVHPEYQDWYHCPTGRSGVALPIFSDSLLIGGWDLGNGLTHAFGLLQIEPTTLQFSAVLECISSPGETIAQFAPRVKEELRALMPHRSINGIEHFGDPAGKARNGVDGRSAIDAAYDAAHIAITPSGSNNNWGVRRDAVFNALTDKALDGESPKFVVCPVRCPVYRAGLQGQYQIETQAGSTPGQLDAVYRRLPKKNSYSHIQDGFQYALVEAWLLTHGANINAARERARRREDAGQFQPGLYRPGKSQRRQRR